MKKEEADSFSLVKGIIFFLDIFLALLIIVTASVLIETSFGKIALVFGFAMLVITTILKLMRKW